MQSDEADVRSVSIPLGLSSAAQTAAVGYIVWIRGYRLARGLETTARLSIGESELHSWPLAAVRFPDRRGTELELEYSKFGILWLCVDSVPYLAWQESERNPAQSKGVGNDYQVGANHGKRRHDRMKFSKHERQRVETG